MLVTGHTGFKGGWLSLWLKELGAEVQGISLPQTSAPTLFEAADVAADMDSNFADIRDLDGLKRLLRRLRPEVVFHLAAQSLVRKSYLEPVETYETNVMGTLNLLEAAREVEGLHSIVVVTSDKCYENQERHTGYEEAEPMGGYDPYSSSKGCVELLTAAYRRSFFQNDAQQVYLATARAGNVIGGGDWAADRLIPDLLKAYSAGVALKIRNPQAVRPWQHVLEPLNGYLMLAERLHENSPGFDVAWNFGPSEEDTVPVSVMVEKLAALLEREFVWEIDGGAHPHEAGILRLNCNKAQDGLGWRPKWGLDEALRNIVDWHIAFDTGSKMNDVCSAQIRDYMGVDA